MAEGPKMTVKSLRIGEHTFELGKKGVEYIETNPPMYAVKNSNGTVHVIYSLNKDAEWKMEESRIEVPKIVLQDGAA